FHSIDRDDHSFLPIWIFADDPGLRPQIEEVAEERTPETRIEWVEHAAHLMITGNLAFDPIESAQRTLFRNTLIVEIEQRRRFERKHGEGAFQDLWQLVAEASTRSRVGEGVKWLIQEAHQFVKCQRLLELCVTLCHSASLLQNSFFVLRIAGEIIGLIAKRVGDKRILKLIRAFLTAGVMENGLVSPSEEGTPQGGHSHPTLKSEARSTRQRIGEERPPLLPVCV